MAYWRLDLSVLLGLLVLAEAYLLGVWPLRRRLAGAAPFPAVQATLFGCGLLTLFVALESPLDTLGDHYLFSMHMTQHLLLVLVVPPLLLSGTPRWLVSPLLKPAPVRWITLLLTAPATAFLLFNTVFALAHLPGVMALTLRNETAHIAEHLIFLATAVLTWWPVLGSAGQPRRLPYPLRMVYLFLQTLPCALVGALITLTGHVLYPNYAAAPRVWDLSPLQDQQIGGLIMWIGGSLYFFLAFTAVFFVWAARDEGELKGGLRMINGQGVAPS